jgi:hypothetical protein
MVSEQKATYTPGPWRISPRTQFRFPTIVSGTGNGQCVATCGGPSGHYANAEANAHLIAAAPALYEALKALIDECMTCPDDCRLMSHRAATAAIAQAEGRAS